jgi:hypothetical protein
MSEVICKTCGRTFKARPSKKASFCSRECFDKIPKWNTGLTKETDLRVLKNSDSLRESLRLNPNPLWVPPQEFKDKMSRIALERGIGGYKRGSGIGKKGWYKGIWCDSSWELAYLLYQEERGVSVQRNQERFSYQLEGKDHYYTPDFIVNGSLVEIKGWGEDSILVLTKARAVGDRDYKILGKKEMKPILDCVIHKHGKDFIKLYG